MEQGLSEKDAMKAVAKDREISKSEVYREVVDRKNQNKGKM